MRLSSRPGRSGRPDGRWPGDGSRRNILVGAHQFGARTQLVADIGTGLELPDAPYLAQYGRLDAQLVPRFHRTLEARLVDADEVVHRFTIRECPQAPERQDGTGLGHRLENEDAGHPGPVREMTLKKWLINRHILDRRER